MKGKMEAANSIIGLARLAYGMDGGDDPRARQEVEKYDREVREDSRIDWDDLGLAPTVIAGIAGRGPIARVLEAGVMTTAVACDGCEKLGECVSRPFRQKDEDGDIIGDHSVQNVAVGLGTISAAVGGIAALVKAGMWMWNWWKPHDPKEVIGQVISSLSTAEGTTQAIAILSDANRCLVKSQTLEASDLISRAIPVLRENSNVPPSVIESLTTEVANLRSVPSSSSSSSSDPRGLLSDDLPSLGATYKSEISLVLSSMLFSAEVSDVKAMAAVKIVLGTENSMALDSLATEFFGTKTLILPIELSSKDESHWIFLIIDSQFGTVKLLDTENAHESAVKSFLAHSPLSAWPFSTIDVAHQQYSDSCGVEGVGQLIAYLKNTTAIDPASAAVVQSVTHLDYLTSAVGSIFNADQFHRVKDYLLEQVNKAINFALDTNNQALVLDLLNQADSVQGMCPLTPGGHPFKPDHDDPDGSFERVGSNQQNRPLQDNPISLAGDINGTIYDGQGAHE